MHVLKRDGRSEAVSFDKILTRIESLCKGLERVDVVRVAQRVVQGIHQGVRTTELDALAAETAAALSTHHPQYARLAGRIAASNLQKQTGASLEALARVHYAPEVASFYHAHREAIERSIRWERDLEYDIFGFKTLERSYLLRDPNTREVMERPQAMLMRVALGVHCGDLPRALETYELLSVGAFTHATPTMFNAGTRYPHLASCFLLPVEDDSIEGIFETVKKCAVISKAAGGIGLSVSNVRASGSSISTTGGQSAGLLPMLRTFESTARYVDQGGGKRKGAFAVYLEPWHLDMACFLDLKKNHGAEETRVRDLFYALWIPDVFMRRVEQDGEWTLFCPSECGALVELHGAAFEAAYADCEARKASLRHTTMRAQELWFAILDAQVETGTPYLLYKDAANAKSNHQHLGTIRSSNLCTEIIQYSSADEIAVCNLASISLPRCVRADALDFDQLASVVRVVTRNLDVVIDRNAYARPEARTSNERHRPMGIGVQGLADVFAMLEIPFDSEEAQALNRDIFEVLYYEALSESCALAREKGPYPSYEGSPASRGKLQFDLWGATPTGVGGRCDWGALRASIATHGLRNSLLVAPMPTASTAQILGNNECFEPFTSNVYVRRVLAGEFAVVNKHLVHALERRGLWSDAVRTSIVAHNGSVQAIEAIPSEVRALFKTAWELKMRTVLDMAAARAPYIDQSQSLNLFVAEPTHAKLTSMHFYAWKKGLKTGVYYLRSRPAVDAVKVTVPVSECLSCSA
jgi:ribonucleoside-diphosphate reductase alpha subunit